MYAINQINYMHVQWRKQQSQANGFVTVVFGLLQLYCAICAIKYVHDCVTVI